MMKNYCIENLSYGSHETKWDLSILIYRNASLENRRTVLNSINNKVYGEIEQGRVEVVDKIYEYIQFRIEKGSSNRTIKSELEKLFLFVKWCDAHNKLFHKDTFVYDFIEWVNFEIKNARDKNFDEYVTYKKSCVVARILSLSQQLEGYKDPKSLLMRTNLKESYRPVKKDLVENEKVFNFGKLLKTIVNSLTINIVRGELPIVIKFSEDRQIILKGNIKNLDLDFNLAKSMRDRNNAIESRRALRDDESLLDKNKRSNIINLRIDAELLLFISQSNMNLAQALKLKLGEFRWMKVDDDYEVFTVYKNRRQGEATFRCYKKYREFFLRYIQWLRDVGFEDESYLFPFVQRGILQSREAKADRVRVKKVCEELNIQYITPSQLRKFKSNWLFENGMDIVDIKKTMSHQEKTFQKNYQEINKNKAMKQLSNFNTDKVKSIEIGLCSANGSKPYNDYSDSSLEIDCVNPESCLFCVYHKDILSYEYCFKLISHLHLKKLELSISPLDKNKHIESIINRIEEKIEKISLVGNNEKKWIEKAQVFVRSGEYHADWSDMINLLMRIM